MSQLPPPMVLYRLATAHYASRALYLATELGIADHLADGPLDASALADATGTHADSLRRVLRLLVASGVFVEEPDGRFALNDVGAALKSTPGSSRASVQLFAGPSVFDTWRELGTSVRTGEPVFEKVFGKGPFEYFADNPDEGAVFDEAMGTFTTVIAKMVAAGYDGFGEVKRVIDIGGGEGALMIGVLRAHPHLHGAVFDLPRLAEGAGREIEQAGLADRCQFVGGDFFEAVPSGYDAYLIKHVIHDWDDDKAIAILKRIRAAMSPQARLLLVEGVYPDRIEQQPGHEGAARNDCNMMIIGGGRQRSEAQLRALFDAADLTLSRIVPTGMTPVVEGRPR